jgi:uncharacterized SAM-binding protein YcdF (DUF218 family)
MAMTYTQPLMLVLLMFTVIGLVCARRRRTSYVLGWAVFSLFLLTWPPVDWLLSRPLESRYPIQALPRAPADAIVVLSSAVSPPLSERPYPLPDNNTFQRCEFAAWLHRHWSPVPVLACGGVGANGGAALSITMRHRLEQAGVPDAMIWTEERSRTTHENAVYGAEILRKHGIGKIALVLEAKSMPRAEACFRKQGIAVIPAPCEFRELESPVAELIPSWRALKENEETLHEYLGLVWYWLHQWI